MKPGAARRALPVLPTISAPALRVPAAALTAAHEGLPPVVDGFARRVSYLRVSLTDRCNYRCTYCMPEEVSFRPRAELLTFEEIVRIVGIFAGVGVRRVRLTGGEPTVRKDVVTLTRMVAAVPGIE